MFKVGSVYRKSGQEFKCIGKTSDGRPVMEGTSFGTPYAFDIEYHAYHLFEEVHTDEGTFIVSCEGTARFYPTKQLTLEKVSSLLKRDKETVSIRWR